MSLETSVKIFLQRIIYCQKILRILPYLSPSKKYFYLEDFVLSKRILKYSNNPEFKVCIKKGLI